MSGVTSFSLLKTGIHLENLDFSERDRKNSTSTLKDAMGHNKSVLHNWSVYRAICLHKKPQFNQFYVSISTIIYIYMY